MVELTNPNISFDIAAAAAAMGGNLTENMSKLTSAVSSLPVLLEKKRLIDMHTTIATALLDQIKTRKLDMFFELEEKIMAKHASPFGSDRSLIQILEDQDAGTPEDKLRLFLIYFLCSGNNITDAEVIKKALFFSTLFFVDKRKMLIFL